MQRPILTDEQKSTYEKELNLIISAAPSELRDKWKTNPHITWVLDLPHIQPGIVTKLPAKLADLYNTLENKRKGGALI